MVVTSQKQRDIFDKLVDMANGDTALVKQAIWAASQDGKPAPLSKVMDYIRTAMSSKEKMRA